MIAALISHDPQQSCTHTCLGYDEQTPNERFNENESLGTIKL